MAQTLIASRYRVLRELGRGGMGVVYLVEHVGTGDTLALKLILAHADAGQEAIERFKREARAPAKIKSEHVVRVTDADVAPELGGAPFLVMELLDGQDLEKRLAARGRFSPSEVIGILRQAAIALDKAHAIGITHRDLKPENLFLHKRENGEETLKVVDFGISKLVGESANDISNAGLTKSGAMMGTPLYMSPEQARGRVNEIGPATDVWAIGLIAYRLLTGRIYWTASTLAELMVQLLTEPMPPPSTLVQLPGAFDAWFARSTDRNPSARFRSVGEQVAALATVFGLGASARDAAPEYEETQVMSPAVAMPGTYQPATVGVGIRTTAGAAVAQTAPMPSPRTSRAKALAAVIGGGLVVGATIGVVAWRATSSTAPDRTPDRVSARAPAESSEPTTTNAQASTQRREADELAPAEPPAVSAPDAAASPTPPATATAASTATSARPRGAANTASAPDAAATAPTLIVAPTVVAPPPATELRASPPPAADTRPKKFDPSTP